MRRAAREFVVSFSSGVRQHQNSVQRCPTDLVNPTLLLICVPHHLRNENRCPFRSLNTRCYLHSLSLSFSSARIESCLCSSVALALLLPTKLGLFSTLFGLSDESTCWGLGPYDFVKLILRKSNPYNRVEGSKANVGFPLKRIANHTP